MRTQPSLDQVLTYVGNGGDALPVPNPVLAHLSPNECGEPEIHPPEIMPGVTFAALLDGMVSYELDAVLRALDQTIPAEPTVQILSYELQDRGVHVFSAGLIRDGRDEHSTNLLTDLELFTLEQDELHREARRWIEQHPGSVKEMPLREELRRRGFGNYPEVVDVEQLFSGVIEQDAPPAPLCLVAKRYALGFGLPGRVMSYALQHAVTHRADAVLLMANLEGERRNRQGSPEHLIPLSERMRERGLTYSTAMEQRKALPCTGITERGKTPWPVPALQLRSGLELLQCIDAAAYLEDRGYESKVLRFEGAQQCVPMWAAYGHRGEDILAACMPLR